MKYINLSVVIVLIQAYYYSNLYAFNLCSAKEGYLVGFFNGVGNTKKQAEDSKELIKNRYGSWYNDELVNYDIFYNYHDSWYYPDLLETGQMRDFERSLLPDDFLDNYEIFWYPEAVIKKGNVDTKGIEEAVGRLMAAKVEKSVEYLERLYLQEPAIADLAEHKRKMEEYLINYKQKMLLIAHSQGNLFVNRAFDEGVKLFESHYPESDYPGEDPRNTMKVIHVAPASQTARGPYLLGNQDKVINKYAEKLSILGKGNGKKDFTPTPNLRVPPHVREGWIFKNKKCGVKSDYLGHGFKETYFNPDLLAYCKPEDGTYDLPIEKFDALWEDAMSSLKFPSKQERGLFTVSMRTVNSSGVAYFGLAIIEPPPHKRKIHKNSMTTGTYGLFSTYDDDQGNQVQQYEENCEITEMLGGVYEVGIAQYTGTFDDKVIIEVKTYDGKVLYRTRPFGMTPLNNYTSVDDFMHVVDINVKYNFEKKKYDITLERVLDVRE